MKRTFAVILAFAFYSLIIPAGVQATTVDAPHYGATDQGVLVLNSCSTCHSTHDSLGATGYNNICLSCHRSGDAAAGAKPFTLADAADPFKNHSTHGLLKMYQTSHRWDGPDTVPAAGAQPPIQTAMTTSYLRDNVGNNLVCSRCHNQHNQIVLSVDANGVKTLDKNFYRIPNDKDQLCMDCHRSRNVQSHLQGSHPVNVPYPATANFNNPPKNANPTNPTSAVNLNNGSVICSTCHGVHFTDSRSSTVDGPASFTTISTGDGYLLRTDHRGKQVTTGNTDDLNICTNCHAGKTNHNYKSQNIQCVDCHGAHVEYDPNDPNNTKGTNVFLIRRNVTKSGQPNQIMFRYTGSKREYVNATKTGVCQGCHDVPAPGGIYPAQHDSTDPNVCNNCHFHGNEHGSFAGACNNCHGHPPATGTIGGSDGLASFTDSNGVTQGTGASVNAGGNPAGGHVAHVTGRGMDCSTCHDGYANRPMPNKNIDIGFAINGVNVPGFKSTSKNGTYINTRTLTAGYSWSGSYSTTGANQTCTNVYCHGATLTGGSNNNSVSWVGGSNETSCDSCHGFTIPPTSGSHTKHIATTMMMCDYCHGSHNDTRHINGAVEWNFSDPTALYKTPSGTYSNVGATQNPAPSLTYGSCNNKCHGSSSSPNWGGTLWSTTEQCAKCHSSSATVASTGLFYSTSYPTQVTANTDSKVGAHVAHLQGTDITSTALSCTDCHIAISAVSTSGHMSGTTKFAWGTVATYNGASPSYDPATGTCSNVYCHGGAMPGGDASGSNRTPSWKDSSYITGVLADCGKCHGFPPTPGVAPGNHPIVATPTSFTEAATICSGCHPYINPSGTSFSTMFSDKSKHIINGVVDVIAGGCNNCHGYPPANKRFIAKQNNWSGARQENYSGAGGAHTVAGHIKPTANPNEGFANCSNCHNQNDHMSGSGVFLPSSNIKVSIQPRVRFSNIAPQAKYSSNKLDASLHVTGRCSNVACHFQKSPKW